MSTAGKAEITKNLQADQANAMKQTEPSIDFW
jgi:hypothetical protein